METGGSQGKRLGTPESWRRPGMPHSEEFKEFQMRLLSVLPHRTLEASLGGPRGLWTSCSASVSKLGAHSDCPQNLETGWKAAANGRYPHQNPCQLQPMFLLRRQPEQHILCASVGKHHCPGHRHWWDAGCLVCQSADWRTLCRDHQSRQGQGALSFAPA